MKGNIVSDINDRPPDIKRRKVSSEVNVLDYSSSLSISTWESERKLADKIMHHVTKHKMNLKLDKLTRGQGNCFMVAVLQQLKRDNVYSVSSPPVQRLADEFSHQKFRQAIRSFAIKSNDKRISDIKDNYNVARSQEYIAKAGINIGRVC